jgi:ribokinase
VSARVVVVGSVNVDLVVTIGELPRPGETVTGGTFARHGGGKGANQAVAAARLGADVALVAAVGRDDLGAGALEELAAEGVDVSAVVRRDEPTGVALITVDGSGENSIAVASGANAALSGEMVAAALGERLAGAPGVVLLGFEVSDAAVLAGARAAREAGWTVVLNPAPARALPEALVALRPLLTPNADEAQALSGSDSPADAARALAARTGAPVLVTVGADGALLCEGGSVDALRAAAVDVVDTTGAGDAFNGALAAELAGGAALRDAAELAILAAGRSTTRAGARGGMPLRDELGAERG